MSDADELSRTVRAVVEQVVRELRASAASPTSQPSPAAPQPTKQPDSRLIPAQARRVAIGADHGGYAMKEALKPLLAELGYAVEDCGTFSDAAVDYPDFAAAVARRVATGACWRGIMIDGAGIGSCMAANKIEGVRASMCYDLSTARNAREHNDANVLTLGAGLLGVALAKDITQVWLATECTEERHKKRVAKIMALEKGESH
jgi:RpiB/LacA/LacB family sugar-phosphate isomerase